MGWFDNVRRLFAKDDDPSLGAERYRGRPLLFFLDCYVMSVVGALSGAKEAELARLTAELVGGGGDWMASLRAELGLDDAMDGEIAGMWQHNQAAARDAGAVLTAKEFAVMVVDSNFAHLVPDESRPLTPLEAKHYSEATIREAGGRICDWLPVLERGELRGRDEIVARALILNALLNIHFEAPIWVVAAWIDKHGLREHLSASESQLLDKTNDQLTEQEQTNLYWRIESLWCLMWVGGLIADVPFDAPVGDHMASLCPNLERDEGPEKFSERMVLRSRNEVFECLDLHYRLHWWTRDGQLNGYRTGNVSLDIIMERRKALEWVMDPACDWDDVSDDT